MPLADPIEPVALRDAQHSRPLSRALQAPEQRRISRRRSGAGPGVRALASRRTAATPPAMPTSGGGAWDVPPSSG